MNRSEQYGGLGAALAVPFIMGAGTCALNALGGPNIDPVAVGTVSAVMVAPTPGVSMRSMRLYEHSGPNLVYHPARDLVSRVHEGLLDTTFGFEQVLLGDKPFLLRVGEAQVMPVRTMGKDPYGMDIEARVGDDELELSIPARVEVAEQSDGIGIVKRSKAERGARFSLLAHAPYDAFLDR